MRRSFKHVLYREIWKCYLEVEVEELDTLAQDINGLKYSAQVASILDSNEPSISKGMAQLGLKDNQPLVDLKLSPCKSLFSDIVLNLIEFPSLDEKLKQNKSAAQGGLGGFLHGWWSGGEK
ncbi:signal recognition particle subunit SRP68-like [Apostichopus japonicus]|uniref:signal recognition particle subunit SRP68-like n=1 Tax=Stichopus japonicus TaxID=307972 RepID=UPI003AB5AAD9